MKIVLFFIFALFLSSTISLEIKSFAEDETEMEKKLRNVTFSVKCMLVDNFTVYDLTGMAKNRLKGEQKDYNVTINGVKIFYNFCYDLYKDNSCNTSFIQVSGKTSSDCTQMAGSIGTGNKWKISDNFVEIELNPIPNSPDVVKYQIECDPEDKMTEPTYVPSKSYYRRDLNGKKETRLYFKSIHGCPKVNFYTFWKFINEYDFIFAITLIILGLFECIWGNKLSKPTAFIITCAGVIIIVVVLFFQFILPPGTDDWIIWVILFIGLAIGVFAGFFVAKNEESCLSFVVGGVAGFFLGELLFNLFGNRFGENLKYIHYAFIGASILIMVFLATILSKYIIIFSTALIGAYAVVRGISFFAGGFPSEITVIDLARAGETDQLEDLLDGEMYAYLIAIILLTVASIFIQFRLGSKGGNIHVNDVEGAIVNTKEY